MHISSRGRYALQALVLMSMNKNGTTITMKEISHGASIPQNYLQQIFIPLRKAGIIKGIKGINAGYMLNKPANEITVGDVFRCVETSFELIDTKTEAPPSSIKDVTAQLWLNLQQNIDSFVDSITMSELAAQYEDYLKQADYFDYTI